MSFSKLACAKYNSHPYRATGQFVTTRSIIWIASYPKSGSTWVASVLEVAGRGYGYPQGGYDAYVLQSSNANPQICQAVAVGLSQYPCSVLKTHSPFRQEGGLPHEFGGLEPVTAAFIHIYRNPLDVLLSYIGFTRIEYAANAQNEVYRSSLFVDLLGLSDPIDYDQWRTMGIDALAIRNLDHALDMFSERGMSIPRFEPMAGTWLEHLKSWQKAAKIFPGISLRYEDCLRDPETFAPVAELFSFGTKEIGLSVDYVNLRTKKMAIAGSEQEKFFYNKMRARYFTKYFSAAAIDRFFATHEQALLEAGYSHLLEIA